MGVRNSCARSRDQRRSRSSVCANARVARFTLSTKRKSSVGTFSSEMVAPPCIFAPASVRAAIRSMTSSSRPTRHHTKPAVLNKTTSTATTKATSKLIAVRSNGACARATRRLTCKRLTLAALAWSDSPKPGRKCKLTTRPFVPSASCVHWIAARGSAACSRALTWRRLFERSIRLPLASVSSK